MPMKKCQYVILMLATIKFNFLNIAIFIRGGSRIQTDAFHPATKKAGIV